MQITQKRKRNETCAISEMKEEAISQNKKIYIVIVLWCLQTENLKEIWVDLYLINIKIT